MSTKQVERLNDLQVVMRRALKWRLSSNSPLWLRDNFNIALQLSKGSLPSLLVLAQLVLTKPHILRLRINLQQGVPYSTFTLLTAS